MIESHVIDWAWHSAVPGGAGGLVRSLHLHHRWREIPANVAIAVAAATWIAPLFWPLVERATGWSPATGQELHDSACFLVGLSHQAAIRWAMDFREIFTAMKQGGKK